jgi:hypothetical protein
MTPELIAAIAAAASVVGHGADVASTVRNFRWGLDEDNPWLAAVIEWTGGPYAAWRWIKLGAGLGFAVVIYRSCRGEPGTEALSALLNGAWAGFLASTAMRNWMAGDAAKRRVLARR